MKKIQITDLLIFIISAELTGALSALIVGDFSVMYNSLIKPPLSPPPIVFPVVWAVLYAIMGISAYLIYNAGVHKVKKKTALFVYFVQLFVNFMWSIIYFKFNSLIGGALLIVVLDILVILMIYLFKKIRPFAAYLNYPYFAWLIFATYLNFTTVFLN